MVVGGCGSWDKLRISFESGRVVRMLPRTTLPLLLAIREADKGLCRESLCLEFGRRACG